MRTAIPSPGSAADSICARLTVRLGNSLPVRNFHPSSRLVSGEADVTNPTEGELLTHLRAVAGRRAPELLLERGNGENLRACPGGEVGMVALSKDKGPGRGVFSARQEVPVATAERVFSAYLAGDPDFDRGLKWQPVPGGALSLAAWMLVLLALLALALLLIR